MAVGPFSIVYADPPWGFGDKQANRPFNYRRMKGYDIRALAVRDIVADDAFLFLWAPDTHTPLAFAVIRDWGFEFKTLAFAWVKTSKDNCTPKMGMGHWTRKSTELCWLGVRGKPNRASAAVRQVLQMPALEHSRKPQAIRDRIERLCGDLPRIELFARGEAPTWVVLVGRRSRNTCRGPTVRINHKKQMKIARTVKLTVYEDSDTKMASLTVSAEFDRDGLARVFSEDLANRVFAALDEEPQGNLPLDKDTDPHDPVWRLGSFEPNYRFETHNVTLNGAVFGVHPAWKVIDPVKGKREVKVSIVLPLVVESKEDAGKIWEIIGTKQTVEFSTQREIKGVQPPAARMIPGGPHGNAEPVVAP